MYIQIILYTATIVLAALYVFVKRAPKKGKSLPGPTGLPVIGYAHKLNGALVHELFAKFARKYGGIFHLKSLGEDVVVLNDADVVRSFFCDEQNRSFTNDRAVLFWSEMVTFKSKGIAGARHAIHSEHGILKKNFVRGMHVYGEGIPAFEEKFRLELVKVNEQLASYNGEEFDLRRLIINCMYSFVSIFLSGQPINDDATRHLFWDFDNCSNYLFRPDVNLILSTIPALRFVPGPYKRAFDAMIRARDVLLQKYFYDIKKTYQPGKIRGLVDFYLNEQRLTNAESCSDERVCAVVLEVLLTGVISTLSHLSSLFLCLTNFPEYQAKIQEEIDRVIGVISTLSHLSSLFLCLMNHPEYQTKVQEEIDRVIGTDGQPSLSDKHACVLIDAVGLETHRFITTVPVSVPRMCNTNFAFQGYDIPANSTLITNIWFIHHDEKVWGDPWTFRPERWIGDDGALLPNDHVLRKNFLAFNTGRRQCIGESLARSRAFLLVTTVLQRWNLEMTPEHFRSCDPRDGGFTFKATCYPKPYLCRAVPRKI